MFDRGKKGTSARDSEQQPESTSAPAPSAPAPQRQPSHREAAVIGPSIHIDGDLRGEEDLLIDGEVSGTVQLKSNSLTVGSQGKVRADVYAHTIFVEGLVEGDLYGSERVVIRKTAQVRGNITSPRVSLEEGARFKGSIEMDSEVAKSTLGAQRGAAPRGVSPSEAAFVRPEAAGGEAAAKRGATN